MYCWQALELEGVHRAAALPCLDQIRHNMLSFKLELRVVYVYCQELHNSKNTFHDIPHNVSGK
jgi:hypothetical protein